MRAKYLARRLCEIRQSKGITQQGLANALDVSRVTVSRWERGEVDPPWSAVVNLCDVLGVEPGAFLEEPAESDPPKPGRPKGS